MRVGFVAFLSTLLSGCAGSPSLYYWGDYETILLSRYLEPGSMDTQREISQLEQGIQSAEQAGRTIAPGIYLHLAMLYAENGNETAALSAFDRERQHFPEAAAFITGVIERDQERNSSKGM